LSWYELVQTICEHLEWVTPTGQNKVTSCANALGEQPTRLSILWGESPLPSIARFGRQAYPEYGKVTTHAEPGGKRHGRHAARSHRWERPGWQAKLEA